METVLLSGVVAAFLLGGWWLALREVGRVQERAARVVGDVVEQVGSAVRDSIRGAMGYSDEAAQSSPELYDTQNPEVAAMVPVFEQDHGFEDFEKAFENTGEIDWTAFGLDVPPGEGGEEI